MSYVNWGAKTIPKLDKTKNWGFFTEYDHRIKEILRKEGLITTKFFKTAVNYPISNEGFHKALPLLTAMAAESNVSKIRFAGITGGGTQYLRLVSALADSGKEIDSICAIDINVMQLLNLSHLAERMNHMARHGIAFEVTNTNRGLKEGGYLEATFSFSYNEMKINTESLWQLEPYPIGVVKNSALLPLNGNDLRMPISDKGTNTCSIRNMDTGNKVGEITIRGKDELEITSISGERGADKKVYGFKVAGDSLLSMIGRVEVKQKIPTINAFHIDADSFLDRVHPNDAPNFIYLSNMKGAGMSVGSFERILELIHSNPKFELGTTVMYTSVMNLRALFVLKKVGAGFEASCIRPDGTVGSENGVLYKLDSGAIHRKLTTDEVY
ncbi:MAG TPA: hypothetical protein VMV00_01965 [Candidatus Baltobacteraceae bacterium]|nr:hypothetical protein [Candidatus Baltobacteraceae bacterium]